MLVTQLDVLSGPTAQKPPRCISSGHAVYRISLCGLVEICSADSWLRETHAINDPCPLPICSQVLSKLCFG